MINITIQSYKKDWSLIRNKISNELNGVEQYKNDNSINKLIDYLISAEDHRFRYHLGFDVIAIARAIRNRIVYDKFEGASTIEQQLVRTIILRYERTVIRKLYEICLAFATKLIIDKRTTALIYLNIAYYGTDLIGLDSILNKYKLKKGDFIEDDICAQIVARLKYPEPSKRATNYNTMNDRSIYLLNLYKKHTRYKILRVHG